MQQISMALIVQRRILKQGQTVQEVPHFNGHEQKRVGAAAIHLHHLLVLPAVKTKSAHLAWLEITRLILVRISVVRQVEWFILSWLTVQRAFGLLTFVATPFVRVI
jgi:hypothetical protein